MSFDDRFAEQFGAAHTGVWTAPGRINLIGEHTDYNDGFMLPLAIPQGFVALARRNPSGLVRMVSNEYDGLVEARVSELEPGSVSGWAAYVAGVVWSLRDAGHDVGGLDILVHGDVPEGAGLSSSAALECVTALALVDLYGLDIPRPTLARLAQRAENVFVGMPCGILDQSASLLCNADHVLFIDARTLDTESVPFDLTLGGLELLVVNTKAPHRHVDGEYAERRRSCEEAARQLGVPALRDVTNPAEALAWLTDPLLRRRVRHVLTENDRVLDTVERLRSGSVRDIGGLLTDSHTSMRTDYEITVPEIDVTVDTALASGALGARMTGGGFGGCVIALVESDATGVVVEKVSMAFLENGFGEPDFFTAAPSAGARRLG